MYIVVNRCVIYDLIAVSATPGIWGLEFEVGGVCWVGPGPGMKIDRNKYRTA
jgi:hypothetical protein